MTFMTNIPRRKIYETMLEFEDGLIEMQILTFNEKNFNNFLGKFNEFTLSNIKRTYREIKALLLMFLENRKYELGEDFEKDLKSLVENEVKINEEILNNQNFPKNFKKVLSEIDKTFESLKVVESFDETKKVFAILDEFNSHVPKLLEIRRDEMK